jgi:hypothetical protein
MRKSNKNVDKAQELYAKRRAGSGSKSTKRSSTHSDRAQDLYDKKNKKMDLEREFDNYALISFFMSIGWPFVIAFPFIGFLSILLPPVSIVLGAMSLKKIRVDKKLKGRGFAIAGIIISSLTLFFMILGIILVLTIFGSLLNNLAII